MKEKTLYLECFSGISGDMTVAALLDLGADQKVLLDGLNSLKVDGYKIVIGRRAKSSIDACDFDVILEETYLPYANEDYSSDNKEGVHVHTPDHLHNHDHSHLKDHDHNHDHSHLQDHDHNHDHSHLKDHDHDHHSHLKDHDHDHDHSHLQDHDHNHPLNYNHGQESSSLAAVSKPASIQYGRHEHRNLYDIYTIIDTADITDNAKSIAKKIFHIIAVAEAKVHAKSLENVHFHEVGAIDSIVDIVAAAICLDNLNIKEVIVSELYEGTGQIMCQHGLLPIPVPAVANIASEHNLPIHITNVKGELVTPTGAAIVAAIKTSGTLPKEMKILKIGLGAGKRNYTGTAGILRAMLIETVADAVLPTDKVWVLDANLDDCTGEALALTMELLFQNGAKDVYYTPIFMKKNRPAYLLGVICKEEDLLKLEEIIFCNTTTIGIRKHEAMRTILPRIQKTVATPYGDALVKVCTYLDKTYVYPEYDSLKELCKISGKDYMSLYHEVQNLYKNSL